MFKNTVDLKILQFDWPRTFWPKSLEKYFFKGATKLYVTYHSCVVIIFYNTGLSKSAFSTYYFWKIIFRLSVIYVLFAGCDVSIQCLIYRIYNIFIIIVYISAIWLAVMLEHIYLHFWHILVKKHTSREALNLFFCCFFLNS